MVGLFCSIKAVELETSSSSFGLQQFPISFLSYRIRNKRKKSPLKMATLGYSGKSRSLAFL
jgi:hypothetical protein